MAAKKSGLNLGYLDTIGTATKPDKAPRKLGNKTARKQADNQATIQGNFLITPEQKKRVLIYGAEHGLRPSEVVRLALDKFFKVASK